MSSNVTDIYFTDFFRVSESTLEKCGAFNVSLISDLPLFVDPFLLFNSDNPAYQELHAQIIGYMRFLKDRTLEGAISPGLVEAWFSFPEVKQNWLGFSRAGNSGHGLGRDFASALHRNFNCVFRDFGSEVVTHGSHFEKLCLIRDGVGRDMMSDFTTNLIKGHLAEYTQSFACEHIHAAQRRRVAMPKARFNYETRSWATETFELPAFRDDYVLLTPKDILTKDEAWINRPELLDRYPEIAAALPDGALRAQVNDYLMRVIPTDPKTTKDEIREAISTAVERFPEVLDYYIRDKEEHGEDAESLAKAKVRETERWFIEQVRALVRDYLEPGGFYRTTGSTYNEARERLLFLKDVIENKGGHRIFYVDGQPIQREADLHILYRLTWFASPSDPGREANDGRGPADFKISRGSGDKTLVEFKLAKNSQLERNLRNQSPIYEKASDATHPSLKAILYFDESQLARTLGILRKLRIDNDPNVILIDASAYNKPSGSTA